MLIQLTDLPVAAVLVAGAYLSAYTRKLTVTAALTGFICGMIIYLGAGYTGLFSLAAFFISGTLATAWGRRAKQHLEKAGDDTQRKYSQVLANGGTATLLALLILIFPTHAEILILMLAASLASATSDTLSSELGMLYGKNFYNCISWKKEARGLDGVVSLEGTLIGVLGAALIAGIYATGTYSSNGLAAASHGFFIIIIAGVSGNFSDSLFGASLERRKLLNNDWVNFLSTLFAAVVASLLYVIFQ